MKSLVVHLRNRYPGAQVHAKDANSIDVFSAEGELLCAVRNGACAQKELAARDAFSLEPLIKQARVWKINKANEIELDELAAERKEAVKGFVVAGKAPNVAEAKAAGHDVDEKGEAKKKA
jgi:hypothetical protein